jgi:pentapeptide MXKDX repeat protein
MKKLLAICFALSLFLSTAALAQDTMKQDNNMQSDSAPKAVNIKGKISSDGTMFVSDKDGKSWKIVNPDAVKGHEGHHVILNAHVYADKGEVHVMSLKMASDKMSNSMQ